MMTLHTDRLTLRPFRDEDHAPYADFLADKNCTRYLGGTRDAEVAWRVLAAFCGHWYLRGYGPFAVEDKATEAFVGYCGPWFPHGKPEQEIIWGTMPDAQRNGYAAEAARAARHWVYKTCGWPVAVSYIMPENIASRRVAEKLGAAIDGTITYGEYTLEVWRHPPATKVLQ